MERSSSFGTSWADQWDYSDPAPGPNGSQQKKKKKKKEEEAGGKKITVEKTKAAASAGLKKVKEGTANGLQWIKDKYNKRAQKH